MSRQAVNDVAPNDNMFIAEGYPQRQSCTFWNLRRGVQVKTAQTQVLGAGDSSQVRPVKINIDDQTRAIELPALVRRKLFTLIFVKHSENGPSRKKDGLPVLIEPAGIRVKTFLRRPFGRPDNTPSASEGKAEPPFETDSGALGSTPDSLGQGRNKDPSTKTDETPPNKPYLPVRVVSWIVLRPNRTTECGLGETRAAHSELTLKTPAS